MKQFWVAGVLEHSVHEAAMNALSEAPMYIDDTPNISAMELRTKARRLQAEAGLDLVTPRGAERIRALMFTFEDLGKLDPGSIQTLLRNVEKDKLGLALKGATDSLRDVFFSNMSERAGKILKEDMEAMGPARTYPLTTSPLPRQAGTRSGLPSCCVGWAACTGCAVIWRLRSRRTARAWPSRRRRVMPSRASDAARAWQATASVCPLSVRPEASVMVPLIITGN